MSILKRERERKKEKTDLGSTIVDYQQTYMADETDRGQKKKIEIDMNSVITTVSSRGSRSGNQDSTKKSSLPRQQKAVAFVIQASDIHRRGG